MKTKLLIIIYLAVATLCFGQVKTMVGVLKTEFHPGIVQYFLEAKESFLKKGQDDIAKGIETFLTISGGTGFIYVAPSGQNYILTNYHVVSTGYRFKIEFEKEDGTYQVYDNLNLIGVDKDLDLALLQFENQARPFSKGLSFSTTPVADGDDVFSAGFPVLGNQRIWQLGKGSVTNSTARIPDLVDPAKSTLIQHSAQIDAGNSGGPLLVRSARSPNEMLVIGINTWKASARQDVNLSLPVAVINRFINEATTSVTVIMRQERLTIATTNFVDGLKGNSAIYPHIAEFLSSEITGENGFNAMFMVGELAPNTVKQAILQEFSSSPVNGLRQAVGWYIESVLRNSTGHIDLQLGSPAFQDDETAELKMTSQTKQYTSIWRYFAGDWHLDSIEGVTGTTLTEKKATLEKRTERQTNSSPKLYLKAGYALSLADIPNAFRLSGYYAFSDFAQIGMGYDISEDKEALPNTVNSTLRITIPILRDKLDFLPFAGFGFLLSHSDLEKSAGGLLFSSGVLVGFGPLSKKLTVELSYIHQTIKVIYYDDYERDSELSFGQIDLGFGIRF